MISRRAHELGLRRLALVLTLGAVGPLLLAAVFWGASREIADTALRDATLVRDALNLWQGGALARAGEVGTIFDPAAYWSATKANFGPSLGRHTWSYPPPMLLLAVPMSLLPVIPSFLLWNAAGACLLWLGARAAGLSRGVSLLAVVSPAALESALVGQNGLLCAALALPGFVLLDRRPFAAGALLGALILKPQLGVLVPVCLLASRNWRGAAGAALSAAMLAAASTAAFGWESWFGFAGRVMPFMRDLLEAPWSAGAYQPMLATPFIVVRSAGASLGTAYAVQAGAAAGALLLCWRAWRAPAGVDGLARAALTLALTFLVTPYGYCYDMPALAAALIGLAARDGLAPGGERSLFAIAWIVPGLGTWLAVAHMPPLGLAAVVCAAGLAWGAARGARCNAPRAVHSR